METTREFLMNLGFRISSDGRRRWPDDLKPRIVAEILPPGASVNAVAAKYDIGVNHLSSRRRMAKDGLPVLPVIEEETGFAPLVVLMIRRRHVKRTMPRHPTGKLRSSLVQSP